MNAREVAKKYGYGSYVDNGGQLCIVAKYGIHNTLLVFTDGTVETDPDYMDDVTPVLTTERYIELISSINDHDPVDPLKTLMRPLIDEHTTFKECFINMNNGDLLYKKESKNPYLKMVNDTLIYTECSGMDIDSPLDHKSLVYFMSSDQRMWRLKKKDICVF